MWCGKRMKRRIFPRRSEDEQNAHCTYTLYYYFIVLYYFFMIAIYYHFTWFFVLIATVFVIHKFYNSCVCYAKLSARSRARITNLSAAVTNCWSYILPVTALSTNLNFILLNFFGDDLMFMMAKQNLHFSPASIKIITPSRLIN